MIKNKASVMFDLDDTLAHLAPAFSDFVADETGRTELKDNLDKWNIYPDLSGVYPGLNIHELFLEFERKGHMHKLKPTILSKLLHACNNGGRRIHVVTARGWMKDGVDITKHWLRENNIPYHSLDLVNLDFSKTDLIKARMDDGEHFDTIVEDNVKHLNELSDLVKYQVIVDQPWNRTIRNNKLTGKYGNGAVRVYPHSKSLNQKEI
jgi:hypothetical protein